MSLFFNALVASSGGVINISPFRLLIIGDSIANGTSNGVGDAVDGTLKEWNGSAMVDITGDTIDANTGSPYPAMAAKINELTGRTMHLVETANGGSEFAPYLDTNNWADSGGVLYGQMLTKAGNYLTNQNASKFDAIRITLGINDARGTTSLATVQSGTTSLIDRLNTDFPNTPILINQLGKSSADPARVTAVRGYIDDLVTTYSNVYAGKDLNEFPSGDYYDGLHLTQSANNQLGETDAVNLLNII